MTTKTMKGGDIMACGTKKGCKGGKSGKGGKRGK